MTHPAAVIESLWTKRQCAEYLGVSVRALERMPVPRVTLPSSGKKAIVRYDPAQVRAWVDVRRSRPLAVVTKKAG